MMRHPVCDVPGCNRPRRRLQRLCKRCYAALPGDIRQGLIDAHAARKRPAWHDFKARAADYLGLATPDTAPAAAPISAPITATAFQQRQAAMLGERD